MKTTFLGTLDFGHYIIAINIISINRKC